MAYPECILKKLRMRYGYDEDDTSHDVWFNRMSRGKVFDETIAWDRSLGFDFQIRMYIEDIHGINLDNTIDKGNK